MASAVVAPSVWSAVAPRDPGSCCGAFHRCLSLFLLSSARPPGRPLQYQPGRRIRAQHLGVDVAAPIAQHLVVLVPVALAPRVGEVGVGVDDLLAIVARRPADRPAGVADDQALADERLAALGADPVGGGDEDRVASARPPCRGCWPSPRASGPGPGIGTQLVGTQTMSAPWSAHSRKLSGNQQS